MKVYYRNNIAVHFGDWDYMISMDVDGNEFIGNPMQTDLEEREVEVATNPDGSRYVVEPQVE